MARPIEYNRDEVVNAALQLFWRDGYEATTIEKLLAAMELNRGSFYAAFGDKEGLFIEVLASYIDIVSKVMKKSIESNKNPLDAIYSYFEHFALLEEEEIRERGCLICNTASELSHTKPHLANTAWQKGWFLRNFFIKSLREVHGTDKDGTDKAIGEMADHLITLAVGLRMQCKMGTSPEVMKNILDLGMKPLTQAEMHSS
jgi:TetR/AcrR family transcriptional repressor of nem operon